MTRIVPPSRPRLSTAELETMLALFSVDRDKFPLIIAGVRGYYLDTMGAPGKNDRGLYDDALFIHTPNVTAAFNGNTDPDRYRPGWGTGKDKGMASLKAGIWYCYQFDIHHGMSYAYPAICQRAGKVTVLRDGNPPYEDTGMFGINIHCGGWRRPGSGGCQTVHPEQWPAFYTLGETQAKHLFGFDMEDGKPAWKRAVIPYALFEEVR
jgi:hypothetical protein